MSFCTVQLDTLLVLLRQLHTDNMHCACRYNSTKRKLTDTNRYACTSDVCCEGHRVVSR